MLRIKEVEMVESVDHLKSSRSIKGTHGPDFELLDARIASALNKIIQNTRFKKKVSLEEMKAHKEDRFLRGRQIADLTYEHFRVTGANDSVVNYADLFTIALRNDDIQEFDSKWDEILSSMTQIPTDDILEKLYNLRIRESEKSVAILAQVGIQAPGLSFRCICHLGNPIKTRSESGVFFCLLCTSHGPCCLSPYHQVWEIWLYWILSALCGGIWVYSWEEASHVQDLWENIPTTERHSLRLLTCQK